jgi:hypothetical protein
MPRPHCALPLTRSTVPEALLASHFGMRFDNVHTTNVSHVAALARPDAALAEGWSSEIESRQGIECEPAE